MNTPVYDQFAAALSGPCQNSDASQENSKRGLGGSMPKLPAIVVTLLLQSCGMDDEIDHLYAEWRHRHRELITQQEESKSKPVPESQESPIPFPNNVDILIELDQAPHSYSLTNQSTYNLYYLSYGPGYPLYTLEGRRPDSEEWISLLGWCGTGLEIQTLPPGESIVIAPRSDFITPDIAVIRVGMHFSISRSGEWRGVYGEPQYWSDATIITP